MTEGICIYCTNLRSLTREHVVPRALGGDATALLVCVECRFSELDHALAERSMLSLDRAGFTPAGAFKVGVGDEIFVHDSEYDLDLEAALRNGMTAEPLPQLHFRAEADGTQPYPFVRDPCERGAFVAFVDDRIQRGTLRALHRKIGPVERCSTPRIVLHRSNDGFIRAASDEVAVEILQKVELWWHDGLRDAVRDGSLVSSVTEKPHLEIRRSIKIDDEYRALAKIAFNAMAMAYGRDFALRAEFNPIRDYISGRDVRRPEKLAPDEVAVDHRFVEKARPGGSPFLPSAGHTIAFDNAPRGLIANVTLYASHDYLVQLGPVTSPRLTPWFWEFSLDRSGNRILDPIEVYRRTRSKPSTDQVAPTESSEEK